MFFQDKYIFFQGSRGGSIFYGGGGGGGGVVSNFFLGKGGGGQMHRNLSKLGFSMQEVQCRGSRHSFPTQDPPVFCLHL